MRSPCLQGIPIGIERDTQSWDPHDPKKRFPSRWMGTVLTFPEKMNTGGAVGVPACKLVQNAY